MITVLAGLDHQPLRFLPASLLSARILLFLSVAVAIAFGLVIPLLRMNRRNAAARPSKNSRFQERLLTLAEKPNRHPIRFSNLLAADTMSVAASSDRSDSLPPAPFSDS